jgi:NTE family protein
VLSLVTGGFLLSPPKSMLDNTPLRQMLEKRVDWRGIRKSIDRGHLRALALCATSYVTGQSVSFYDARESVQDWSRVQRVGRRSALTLDHLMASVAIPLLFPPMRLGEEHFGDGAMRQMNPLSPAIHLGADRLLVVGVRARRAAGVAVTQLPIDPPTPGQIFGYMLDTLFTDSIYGDLEQLERINQLVHAAPDRAHGAKDVQTLMLAPSIDPRQVAARHIDAMPRSLRALLRVIGARDVEGSQLASYLMFEAPYTQDLIRLGYEDAMAARTALLAFVTGETLPSVMTSPGVAQAT